MARPRLLMRVGCVYCQKTDGYVPAIDCNECDYYVEGEGLEDDLLACAYDEEDYDWLEDSFYDD